MSFKQHAQRFLDDLGLSVRNVDDAVLSRQLTNEPDLQTSIEWLVKEKCTFWDIAPIG